MKKRLVYTLDNEADLVNVPDNGIILSDGKLFEKENALMSELFKKVDRSPKSLLIYYGYPISFEGLWDAQKVVDSIASNYDVWVCGDYYQDPAHAEYASTTAIISGLLAKGVEVYGYIPLGVNSENRSISTLETAIDDWNTLGVTGIFMDEFGFDYETTRDRQVTLANYTHSKSLKYIANAWIWEDFSIDIDTNLPAEWAADDWRRSNFTTYNPNNTTLPRNADDAFLVENFGIDSNGMSSNWDFVERLNNIINRNPNNYPLHAVAVYPESPAGTPNFALLDDIYTIDDLAEYVWIAGYIFGMTSVGGNGYSFGSAGGTSNIRTPRVKLDETLSSALQDSLTISNGAGTAVAVLDDGSTLSLTAKPGTGFNVSIDTQKVFEPKTATHATITDTSTLNADMYYLVDNTSAITLTLPSPKKYATITILSIGDFTVNNVTLDGANNINGSATSVLSTSGEHKLIFTGTEWRLI